MMIKVVGSGNSTQIIQNENTYFSNSSVARCHDGTILNAVISSGIIDSDEKLHQAPVQHYGDAATAFKIRKIKRDEILSKKYFFVYVIGSSREKKHKLDYLKSQITTQTIKFITHRQCYLYYIQVLLKLLSKDKQKAYLYWEIFRVLCQFCKPKVDKTSTGVTALIISLKNNFSLPSTLCLDGIGNVSNNKFFYSKKLNTKNIKWNTTHSEADQKVLRVLKFSSIQIDLI